MAGKLTAAFVKSARHSGRTGRPEKHYDMHGLFLQVMPSGSKQFVQRLVVAGKRSDYGLGGYPIISLAEAREAAWENRRAARWGEAPQVEARRRVTVARRVGEAPPVAGGPAPRPRTVSAPGARSGARQVPESAHALLQHRRAGTPRTTTTPTRRWTGWMWRNCWP